MSYKNKGYLYLSMAGLFVICVSVIYLSYGGILPDRWGNAMLSAPAKKGDKPRITKDTVIKQELRYLCGDSVKTDLPTTGDLVGLDWKGLTGRFSAGEGWIIDDSVKGKINLIKEEKQFCPKHRSYRHLGINNGYLAVYEGPLGSDEKVLNQEDIREEDLPVEFRENLEKCGRFGELEPGEKELLQQDFEFVNELKINEWLENLDEFRAE